MKSTKFELEIFADMKNIKSLAPNGGVNNDDMGYFFKMRCENCGDMTGEQCAYLKEMVKYKGKIFNLKLKCKFCSREGFVRLIPGSGTAFTALHAERKVWAPLMVFECHGLVPEEYNFNGGWMIETDEKPPRFVEANFVSGNFVGSAEDFGSCIPSVTKIEGRFVQMKDK